MPAEIRPDTIRNSRVNLADSRLGARVLAVSDEFFAPAARMLRPTEPEWREGVYDAHGKWMDGWESRRRRTPGHDFCVIQLAWPGTLALIDVDTRYFTGNYPPRISLDASTAAPGDQQIWVPLQPESDAKGDAHNCFEITDARVWSHLRLCMYPDGGIARLRAYGTPYRDWSKVPEDETVELSAVGNGGLAVGCSDEHYGSMHNLLLPGRGLNMGDGWETRRRRGPGHDWVVIRLGHPGHISGVEIDTAHFKGNYPHEVSLDAAAPDASDGVPAENHWRPLMDPQRLQMDALHRFVDELHPAGDISHVRVNIHPDGGLSRVRIFGHVRR